LCVPRNPFVRVNGDRNSDAYSSDRGRGLHAHVFHGAAKIFEKDQTRFAGCFQGEVVLNIGIPSCALRSECLARVFWETSLCAACDVSSSEYPGSNRLRHEPEIVHVAGLLDDERNHAAQAHRDLPDHHLQNRSRRPHHCPQPDSTGRITGKRFPHPLFLSGWAALCLW
jgi:hypothetical protein